MQLNYQRSTPFLSLFVIVGLAILTYSFVSPPISECPDDKHEQHMSASNTAHFSELEHLEHAHHHAPTPFAMPLSPKTIGKNVLNPAHYPTERHLQNVQQLTFGGENAEAYFSFDNNMLVLQRKSEEDGVACDQIFYGKIPQYGEKLQMQMVSTGQGRTTCSYFLPGDQAVLYASTHRGNRNCPPEPNFRQMKKYVWPLYPTYEIYYADLSGQVTKQLTRNDFYDAEATVSPDGNKIVFTSTRSGDIELYVVNVDGSGLKQITFGLGYDGGAFFSPNSKEIVFRSSRPNTPEKIREYKELLRQDLVAPTEMEIYVCNVDGSNLRQITNLGRANWAPYFHPSGQKILFSSNHSSERGFPFNIYMINVDGTGLEQITFDKTFDSFPMFSYDGKKIAFSSNRNNGGTRDTNVFIADWVD